MPPERRRRPALDEKFSIDEDPEDVLRTLLGVEEDESGEDEDS